MSNNKIIKEKIKIKKIINYSKFNKEFTRSAFAIAEEIRELILSSRGDKEKFHESFKQLAESLLDPKKNNYGLKLSDKHKKRFLSFYESLSELIPSNTLLEVQPDENKGSIPRSVINKIRNEKLFTKAKEAVLEAFKEVLNDQNFTISDFKSIINIDVSNSELLKSTDSTFLERMKLFKKGLQENQDYGFKPQLAEDITKKITSYLEEIRSELREGLKDSGYNLNPEANTRKSKFGRY